MSATLEFPIIPADAWQRHVNNLNGAGPQTRLEQRSTASRAKEWEAVIDQLEEMRELENNWDGLGGRAPTGEILNSAGALVCFWMERGLPPPTRVVATTAGTILLEFQASDGSYAEFEVDRRLHAEVMMKRPGQPAQHWELPTH